MRVVVDLDLCQGHAQCEDVAPEVFAIGEDGLVRLLEDEPAESLRRHVEQAVRLCPENAIRLEE